MNRLDICDAYYMFAKECRSDHGCYWRCVLFRLERMGYKPGKYVQSGKLTKGALKIYEDLRVRETSRALASIHLARIRLSLIDRGTPAPAAEPPPRKDHMTQVESTISQRLQMALKAEVQEGLILPGVSNSVFHANVGGSKPWGAMWNEPGQPQMWLGWFGTELEAFQAWRERFDAAEPGALDAALAAYPAIRERLARLVAKRNAPPPSSPLHPGGRRARL